MVLTFRIRLAFVIVHFFRRPVLSNLFSLTLLIQQIQFFFFQVILEYDRKFIMDFDHTYHCTWKLEKVLFQYLMAHSI
jgi:hypothetical protein